MKKEKTEDSFGAGDSLNFVVMGICLFENYLSLFEAEKIKFQEQNSCYPSFLGALITYSILMSKRNEDRGVFLYDEPTIDKLKSCSFFWKNVIVFESYLTEVEHAEKEDLVEPTLILLKEGILRICTPVSRDLRSDLTDKIYYGLDRELWNYVYKNAERIAINPNLPENAEQIVQESTKRDSQDKNLQDLMDNTIYNSIKEKWMDALRENGRIPLKDMPQDMKKAMIAHVREIVKLEYDQYLQKRSRNRFGFEYRNRYLLEQMSVSSALFAPMQMLPYYSYKLGDYSVRDARKYLAGLNAIMPFVRRASLDNFTFEEIIEIRRKKKWNGAMIRLSELCNETKTGLDFNQFSEELQSKVVSEYQDALDQESVTWKDLRKDLLKDSAFTGISLIPIIGTVVSTIAGFADPIISYFRKEQKQKSLPIFLNDLRKLRS